MSGTYVILISAIFLPLLVLGQYSSDCKSKETCQDCIQEINCIWCIAPKNHLADKAPIHCIDKDAVPNNWCSQDLIVSPQSSQKKLQDFEFSSNIQNTIQFKPQRIKLSLRNYEKVDVHFQYQQSKNYPVDLYYIMDLSNSMKPHKEKLGKLGVTLAEALKKLTSNVRLGFGSFIDKVDLPFVSTVESKLKEPCPKCVSPYSFINHLNLSSDYNKFIMEVTKAKVSGNLDSPEGGLDAIMQAIVCKEQIGWRSQARHLLVFSTDAEFHIAGDGKLAGVIEPNDAKCHVTNNSYTEYLKYDYPSVSQINHVAKENNINIIFAIVRKDTSNIRESYQMLSKHIENSNFGEVRNDDNSVIDLVINNYNKIVQSVTLTSNATDVDVKFSSSCNNSKPNGCGDVHEGEVVNFTATIQPRKCLSGGQNKKIISIKPEALHEHFIIELDVLCDCPCASPTNKTYQANSRECTYNGDLECGICKCANGRFGRNCQCDNAPVTSEDFTNCRINEQAEICSGQGECKCGKCECNKRSNPNEIISGQFCQCNNYSCKKEGGLLCSGKERGTCHCGVCMCNAGYKGDACQCPNSNTTCRAPGNNLVCSGYGVCNCGKCECTIGGGHSGTYCEICTTCPDQRCEELQPCVECQAYHTGIYNKSECKTKCTSFNTSIVDKLSNDDDIKKCRVPDKSGCIIIFELTDNENNELTVRALKEKLCPVPPNILAWILGVVGTILIAGLIMLIIWKVCTTIHDRREYAKFENERKGLKWHRNDNPLYKEATSTFANPVYNRSVSRLPSK